MPLQAPERGPECHSEALVVKYSRNLRFAHSPVLALQQEGVRTSLCRGLAGSCAVLCVGCSIPVLACLTLSTAVAAMFTGTPPQPGSAVIPTHCLVAPHEGEDITLLQRKVLSFKRVGHSSAA